MTTWTVNAETGATSTYENFALTGFGMWGKRQLAIGPQGIYELGQDDDDGEVIEASVSFGNQGYGSNRIKVVQHIYLGVASAKPMRANVTVDGKSYTYDARSMNELLKTQRIDLGRGLRGTHPLITLMNSAGSDFELESMRPTIVTIDRSI